MKLSTSQKQQFLQLYSHNNESFFTFLDSSSYEKKISKLNNAKTEYANFSSDEEVLFLLDDTFFGSADEGIVITSKAIYTKKAFEDKKIFYIKNITKCQKSGNNKITINSHEIEMVYLENLENSVVNIINQLLKFYKENIIKIKKLDIYSTITIPYSLSQSGGKFKDSVSGLSIPISNGDRYLKNNFGYLYCNLHK